MYHHPIYGNLSDPRTRSRIYLCPKARCSQRVLCSAVISYIAIITPTTTPAMPRQPNPSHTRKPSTPAVHSKWKVFLDTSQQKSKRSNPGDLQQISKNGENPETSENKTRRSNPAELPNKTDTMKLWRPHNNKSKRSNPGDLQQVIPDNQHLDKTLVPRRPTKQTRNDQTRIAPQEI